MFLIEAFIASVCSYIFISLFLRIVECQEKLQNTSLAIQHCHSMWEAVRGVMHLQFEIPTKLGTACTKICD